MVILHVYTLSGAQTILAKANEPVLGLISGHLVWSGTIAIGVPFASKVPVTTAARVPELIIAI